MRSDDVDFLNKLAFEEASGDSLDVKDSLLQVIKPKLEEWFEVEVHNAYDYDNGWHAVSCLFHDLRHSEIAKDISMLVFNESFGYLARSVGRISKPVGKII